ncbi:GNAT family N-acetyltransferase [Niallia sp. 01092]|uniref:GNAT family N-acetyltransferase n=1 Tax=unclassified Niallia TaxID=2837522 RepID=UPI003FCF4EB3
MTLTYRVATLEDAKSLLSLSHRSYEPIRKLGLPFPAATASLSFVEENITKNTTYIAEKDGNIVATVTLKFPWNDPNVPFSYPYFWWLAVDPDYKNQGIAATVLTYIEETIARDTLKAPGITCNTSEDHPWLIDLYLRRGYERVGKLYYGENGEGTYMRKILNPHLVKEKDEDLNFVISYR